MIPERYASRVYAVFRIVFGLMLLSADYEKNKQEIRRVGEILLKRILLFS